MSSNNKNIELQIWFLYYISERSYFSFHIYELLEKESWVQVEFCNFPEASLLYRYIGRSDKKKKNVIMLFLKKDFFCLRNCV